MPNAFGTIEVKVNWLLRPKRWLPVAVVHLRYGRWWSLMVMLPFGLRVRKWKIPVGRRQFVIRSGVID